MSSQKRSSWKTCSQRAEPPTRKRGQKAQPGTQPKAGTLDCRVKDLKYRAEAEGQESGAVTSVCRQQRCIKMGGTTEPSSLKNGVQLYPEEAFFHTCLKRLWAYCVFNVYTCTTVQRLHWLCVRSGVSWSSWGGSERPRLAKDVPE